MGGKEAETTLSRSSTKKRSKEIGEKERKGLGQKTDRCWILSKEISSVEQHLTSGKMISCKDGGTCLVLK